VRVTHPFQPLRGRTLACIGERYNRYGTRLLLRVDGDDVCSVPPSWTDVAPPDPEVVLGGGRAAFRVGDLLQLAALIERQMKIPSAGLRKSNDAAYVNPTSPQARRDGKHHVE
jgi:hypothetical protein